MEFEAVKQNGKLAVATPKLWQDELNKYPEGTKFILTLEKKTQRRTLTQNAALHKWFELVADALNDAGYSIQYVLKYFTVDIDWDKDSVKSVIWKPIQEFFLKKRSTTELDKTSDIDRVYEHLNRAFGEKLGIHVPFPVDELKTKSMLSEKNYQYPTDYKEPTI